MDEFVLMLKGLWSEEHFTMHGEFYQADDATLAVTPVRVPHPPIYTASRAVSGKDVIADHCDLWFVTYEADYRRYEENFLGINADVSDLSHRARPFARN